MPWVGPFRLKEMLQNCLDHAQETPQEAGGVYVVSEKAWTGAPDKQAGVLYVGGNTGESDRFKTRIGDLIADMFGFFGSSTGHHSGGRHLHEWCKEDGRHPWDLYIGWKTDVGCPRCAEYSAFEELEPSENRIRPSRCRTHGALR
jgi:hypothetical protein